MKTRSHHNTDGRRQIKRGKTREFVRHLAARLGIGYRDLGSQARAWCLRRGYAAEEAEEIGRGVAAWLGDGAPPVRDEDLDAIMAEFFFGGSALGST